MYFYRTSNSIAPRPVDRRGQTAFRRQAGAAAELEIDEKPIHDATEVDAAFAAIGKGRPDAVIVQSSLPTKRAAQLALDYRIPAACTLHAFVDEGGLMSYWFAEVDLYERAAAIADKVLKGRRQPISRSSSPQNSSSR